MLGFLKKKLTFSERLDAFSTQKYKVPQFFYGLILFNNKAIFKITKYNKKKISREIEFSFNS
jgi:hypothetical protein